jgi:cation:H+ antiporter
LVPILSVAQLLAGIAILYWGAEWLIRGSAGIARSLGVKPLVIGLTVVAYGTSAPELAVATKTALQHAQPIALGTVIGSCAANISLILGLTALIAPPTVDGRIIRREVPVLVGSAIAVPILFRNGVLSRFEGGLLVACAVIFTIATLTVSARLVPAQIDG